MFEENFKYDAKRFVRKVIAIRKAIVYNGQNRIPEAVGIVNELENRLKLYSYNSDEKMARFIDNHRLEILRILPEGSKQSYLETFNDFMNRSTAILQEDYATVC